MHYHKLPVVYLPNAPALLALATAQHIARMPRCNNALAATVWVFRSNGGIQPTTSIRTVCSQGQAVVQTTIRACALRDRYALREQARLQHKKLLL